jgi:hypothetical protein
VSFNYDLISGVNPAGMTSAQLRAPTLLAPEYRWQVCCVAYLLGAAWLFQLAVIRVRGLRAG